MNTANGATKGNDGDRLSEIAPRGKRLHRLKPVPPCRKHVRMLILPWTSGCEVAQTLVCESDGTPPIASDLLQQLFDLRLFARRRLVRQSLLELPFRRR